MKIRCNVLGEIISWMIHSYSFLLKTYFDKKHFSENPRIPKKKNQFNPE
jgi:hypothetical protein